MKTYLSHAVIILVLFAAPQCTCADFSAITTAEVKVNSNIPILGVRQEQPGLVSSSISHAAMGLSAVASAQVQTAPQVQLRALAQASNASDDNGTASANAAADFMDRLTINGPATIEIKFPISVEFVIEFSGTLEMDIFSGANARVVAGFQSVLSTGEPISKLAERRFVNQRFPPSDPQVELVDGSISDALRLSFDIPTSTASKFLERGMLSLGVSTGAGVVVGRDSANSDFFSTLGVRTINFTDAEGEPISGFHVVGDSGITYPVNVPEPASSAIVGLSAAGIVCCFRRR